jgi:hypothetical protein
MCTQHTVQSVQMTKCKGQGALASPLSPSPRPQPLATAHIAACRRYQAERTLKADAGNDGAGLEASGQGAKVVRGMTQLGANCKSRDATSTKCQTLPPLRPHTPRPTHTTARAPNRRLNKREHAAISQAELLLLLVKGKGGVSGGGGGG